MDLPDSAPMPGADMEYLYKLTSTDWRERQAAIQALTQEGQVELITRVLGLVQEDHAHLNVLSPALQVLEQAGRPVIPELIALLNGPDRELRIYIPIILSSLGGPEAVQSLIQAAGDPNQPDNVRFNAIEALGNLRAAEGTEVLRQVLRTGSPFLKYIAVTALGQIGSPAAAAEEDIRLLLEDAYLAEPAIIAFAQICDARSPAAVAEITNWLAKPQASTAQAITALAELARRSPDAPMVESEFLKSLDEAGAQKIADLLQTREPANLPGKDLALVCGWLVKRRPSGADRFNRLKKLAGKGLVDLLAEDSARHTAESALMGQQITVLDELVAAAGSSNTAQAAAAVHLLGEVAKDVASQENAFFQEPAALLARILPGLFDALESEDETLAALAVEALGKAGRTVGPAAILVEAIWAKADHPSSQVRSAAVQALAALGSADLAVRAAAWLKDPDPRRRATALSLLVIRNPGEAASAVLAALDDPAAEVRQAAIELLPRLPGPDIPDRLKAFLVQADPAIRRSAVKAAAQLEPEAARPLLIQAAEDSNSWIRLHAIKCLAQHPHLETLPTLLRHAGDPLPPVRAAVAEGLIQALELRLDSQQQADLRRKLQEMGAGKDDIL